MRAKTVTTIFIVAALITLVFFLYEQTQGTETAQNTKPVNQNSTQRVPGNIDQTGTFADFLKFVAPQSCIFSSQSDDPKVTGMIYLDNGKITATITVVTESEPIITNLIYARNISYTWNDKAGSGFKLVYKSKTIPLTSGESPIDPVLPISYACQPWQPDERSFLPPKTITFVDFARFIRPTILPSGNVTRCQACDSLGDISKQVCLIGLKCSD